jgi:mono/diheme cytochrome c family protein
MMGPRPRLLMLLAAGSLVWLSFAGCERNTPAPVAPVGNTGAPPTVEVEAGPFAEGRKVYQGQGCAKCHTIGDQLAGGPGGGPKGMMRVSLTKVGGKRSREYIIEHVRNAKAHTEKTRMPPYDEKAINDADMQSLADYLVSLK